MASLSDRHSLPSQKTRQLSPPPSVFSSRLMSCGVCEEHQSEGNRTTEDDRRQWKGTRFHQSIGEKTGEKVKRTRRTG